MAAVLVLNLFWRREKKKFIIYNLKKKKKKICEKAIEITFFFFVEWEHESECIEEWERLIWMLPSLVWMLSFDSISIGFIFFFLWEWVQVCDIVVECVTVEDVSLLKKSIFFNLMFFYLDYLRDLLMKVISISLANKFLIKLKFLNKNP